MVRPEHLRRLQTTSTHKLPSPPPSTGPTQPVALGPFLPADPRWRASQPHGPHKASCSINPLLAALILSQAPQQRKAPVVDWFAHPQSRMTRRAAPDYPLDVMWDRAHISVAFPPPRMQCTAAKKFLAEAARGCFIATDSLDPASFNALEARASRTIVVPPHVDNLVSDSRLPAGPPQRLTIFVFDPTVQAQLHPMWCKFVPPGNRL